MKEVLGDFSIREKNLWFELLVDVVVALYYYPKAFRLMMAGDQALSGTFMVGLITSTVILAIIVSSVLSVFLHTQTKPEPKDERDRLIEAHSGLLANRVLVGGVLLIMAYVVLQELAGDIARSRALFTLTPLVIAHLLLVALMLSSMTNSIAKLVSYRRGS
jgi:hypothetical protein